MIINSLYFLTFLHFTLGARENAQFDDGMTNNAQFVEVKSTAATFPDKYSKIPMGMAYFLRSEYITVLAGRRRREGKAGLIKVILLTTTIRYSYYYYNNYNELTVNSL